MLPWEGSVRATTNVDGPQLVRYRHLMQIIFRIERKKKMPNNVNKLCLRTGSSMAIFRTHFVGVEDMLCGDWCGRSFMNRCGIGFSVFSIPASRAVVHAMSIHESVTLTKGRRGCRDWMSCSALFYCGVFLFVRACVRACVYVRTFCHGFVLFSYCMSWA